MAQNRARADTVFSSFWTQARKSEQRATNFSNISLRFLKRSRTTKSTRCELNRINSSSVHIKTFAFSDEYTPLESWTTKTLYQSIWAFLGIDGVRACARFWAISDSKRASVKWLVESGSKFWFRNTPEKVRLDSYRGILVISVIHQIWVKKIWKLCSMCFWYISEMVLYLLKWEN